MTIAPGETVNRPLATTPANHTAKLVKAFRRVDQNVGIIQRNLDRLDGAVDEFIKALTSGDVEQEQVQLMFEAVRNIAKASNAATKIISKHEKFALAPGIDIENTIFDDGIICLIDGTKQKYLQRHLNKMYGMEPAEYIALYNLPADYPMTARSTSQAHAEKIVKYKPWEDAARKRAAQD